jgi:hypothetical protein
MLEEPEGLDRKWATPVQTKSCGAIRLQRAKAECLSARGPCRQNRIDSAELAALDALVRCGPADFVMVEGEPHYGLSFRFIVTGGSKLRGIAALRTDTRAG